ncbi:hypothetical protein ACFOWE_09535 [Planomonospora corallina]|uniref:DUF4115 domain-containing protein n=1 Tax=Planomonospora corallina TaxID=1806052 RepID=A0ABV8I2Z3_9ACTN
MGRHRSDPMGIARLALAGLAALAVLSLIVVGVLSLFGALDSEAEPASAPAPGAGSSSSTTTTSGKVPTVLVECVADRCPNVFLKVAGGDVLLNREMARGEQAQSFDAKVDVVLTDASTVRVHVNGVLREPGGTGERQEFTVGKEE